MKITFLMPCYVWAPSGGLRVVCEYANRLVRRGHEVAIVQPRRLNYASPKSFTSYQRARKKALFLRDLVLKPTLDWTPLDKRVQLLFVPNSEPRYIPDGDAIFATAWDTVASVLDCPPSKGKKCYLIQHYEVWQGNPADVDETWRAPLHKVVIARWLVRRAEALGCDSVTYIPNGVNPEIYHRTRPIEGRSSQVAMMFSREGFKGSADGIAALEIAKRRFPGLSAVFFSTSRVHPSIPRWVEFRRNPRQDFIVDQIFNRSSIFLSPSLSEGWPLPPAEAAACGCAIVSTGNDGVRDYVEHGLTGLLSPPGDVKALADNLCLLLENDSLRVRLAKTANEFVCRLDWERSADLLQAFIEKVTSAQYEMQSGAWAMR